MSYDLSLETTLSGTPKRVMELLTDPALIRKWSGGEAVMEKKEGGRFEMFDGWVSGMVLKCTDSELSFSWKTTDWNDDAATSEVQITLAADEAGTRVNLTQTGLPDASERDSHKTGWMDFFFDPLEDYILIVDKS